MLHLYTRQMTIDEALLRLSISARQALDNQEAAAYHRHDMVQSLFNILKTLISTPDMFRQAHASILLSLLPPMDERSRSVVAQCRATRYRCLDA
jgi:hypothetical protein